jgi:hypothetical protein
VGIKGRKGQIQQSTVPHTMATDRGVINASMRATGFSFHKHGGAVPNGVARPIQDEATVARKYFELEGDIL